MITWGQLFKINNILVKKTLYFQIYAKSLIFFFFFLLKKCEKLLSFCSAKASLIILAKILTMINTPDFIFSILFVVET